MTILKREPVLIQAAALALFNLLGAFGFLHWTCSQLTAANAAIAAVLGLIVRRVVTPLNDPRDAQGRRLTPEAEGLAA